MKRILNIFWNVIQVLIIIYVILAILFMLTSNSYGYSQIGKYVLDADNDRLVIIKKNNSIKVGDLVYYYSVVNEQYKIVYSNVQSINEDKTYTLDNGNNVQKNKIIGKTDRNIPIIGFILNRLKDKIYFVIFVILPMLIVFGYNIYKFIVCLNYERIKE